MKLASQYKTLLNNYHVNTPLRLAHFFAQLEHESNLKPIQENLNYSVAALLRVFKKYFPTRELAEQYARQPEKIANKVYANRMMNGNECSGDGWKFRGRGFIQITGKFNYLVMTKDTGIDYLNNPELLLNEADSMISAVWFWSKNNLNKYADQDNIKQVTWRINGGYNGLNHRAELLLKYKAFFNTQN
ncbi:glycoside hydrolase family 19 protein [Psychroserpens burtonensis]|uniref:Glycoside hydrolase family 19 protein n=1 Tax=Psychroserpens burtonensis TaxID=49278 RepID=A0A5C7BDE8_9FLAO|nr:glycoside hydrolase family 19 protein [Psychroserpens burtonensis]TXE18609.1 glycoside hydrolase family 19 protein [Psychroserpens burtonensis]